MHGLVFFPMWFYILYIIVHANTGNSLFISIFNCLFHLFYFFIWGCMCGKLNTNKLFILWTERVDDSNIIDVCCVELRNINKHLAAICCSLLQIYNSCMVGGVIYASYTTTCLGLIILKTLGLFGNYESWWGRYMFVREF